MKPLICVPMGDPAGIGPEILAAALADPVVKNAARIVVVGNKSVMQKAVTIARVNLPVNLVKENLSGIKEGVLNLLDMNNLDMGTFTYGQVQAQCGHAAFEYIKKSVELAMSGAVDALATPPINKESLKAASVPYLGHTEILGDLSGTKEPLTMFQVRELRVFFLTRHISLADACKAITKERVGQYITLCNEALRTLGIEKPFLAVAGLNPHCGEHGLLGSEEDREILPAIMEAQVAGIKVVGPKPADSVFHFALKGAWDAVLSLYHDQGHIATKMVDFERTVALTIGMPFLRTSVDHGTAFDIAGTGKASAMSMVEAIRLAALYAPHFAGRKK